jgi:hypothetical protein
MAFPSNGIIEERQPRQSQPTAASQKLRYPSRNLLAILLISVLLLIPCFWHRHIEAGDLGSHVYNAWLAQLIEQGRTPGLYIVTQWKNVLFDLLLFYLAKFLGLTLAEKVASSLCVLIFFWGLFALMKAVSSRPPWFLSPCIAMLSYGYIFHMGFMNYYLSLGLACIGLSLVWNPDKNGFIAAAFLAPLMLFAHPLGFLWFLGAAVYRMLWLKIPGWPKLLLPACAIAACLAVRWFIAHHPSYEVEWRQVPLWSLTGTDQFDVFGDRYSYISIAIALLVLLSTALAVFRSSSRADFWKDRRLLFELYVVSFSATALLPENLHTDPNGGWIGVLATRLTLITAIFGLCWVDSLPPRSWHLLSYSVAAAVFFTFLYQDTAFLNRMEASAESVTRPLPFGTRTLASIFAPSAYRTMYLHIPDRACIGHCFLVSNYEPPTHQFRIRVRQGSPVVTASDDDCEDMQSGTYDVQEEDLPLKQIYQCDASDLTRICIRDLTAGEKNGRLGYHPVTNP